MQNQSQFNPAQYTSDTSQIDAFNEGMRAQVEIGREAAEANARDMAQMQKHLATVRKVMTRPQSLTDEDLQDPLVQQLLRTRTSALSSALRKMKR